VFYIPEAIYSGGSPHTLAASITHSMFEVDFIKKEWKKQNLFRLEEWRWGADENEDAEFIEGGRVEMKV